MGAHSLAAADVRWIDLLSSLSDDVSASRAGVPVPATYFMREEWWQDTAPRRRPTRHSGPSFASRSRRRLLQLSSSVRGALPKSTSLLRNPEFLSPARRRERPRIFALVIARVDTLGRASDAARALKNRLQHAIVAATLLAVVSVNVPERRTQMRKILWGAIAVVVTVALALVTALSIAGARATQPTPQLPAPDDAFYVRVMNQRYLTVPLPDSDVLNIKRQICSRDVDGGAVLWVIQNVSTPLRAELVGFTQGFYASVGCGYETDL